MTPSPQRHDDDRPSRVPRRRLYWLAFLLSYAISLSIAIALLHEDLQTTLIGVVIFTAAWLLAPNMNARLHRDLERSARRNGPAPT